MAPRFLQLHLLTSYPASLLNRDDAGFAKRIPFGGVVRTRISSQCLKRHWRTFDGPRSLQGLGVDMAVRSRLTFDRFIYGPLVHAGIAEDLAKAATHELMSQVLGQSPKAKAEAEGESKSGLQTAQITVLGRAELNWLHSEALAACQAQSDPKKIGDALKERLKKAKDNVAALKKAASGLDAAMFGRMVTGDILARGDAAIHVAHAFTVHEEQTESDYFSAVDDLLQIEEGQLGSGHINSTELTSGLFYLYVAVDLPLLVANLEGCKQQDWMQADRKLAAQVLERLIPLMATVSPGAKLGSTAPHAYAHLVLAELGDAQPRTLANAFLQPVRLRAQEPDLLAGSYGAIARHLQELDSMYGRTTERRLAALGPTALLGEGAGAPAPLADLAEWVAREVRDARVPAAAL